MNADLQQLAAASRGLMYLSETDAPFEVVEMGEIPNSIGNRLRQLNDQPGNEHIETVSLEFFFRNMVREETTGKENAARFRALQRLLSQTLGDVTVYRVGTVQVEAYIIGRLADGNYGGLRTRLVET